MKWLREVLLLLVMVVVVASPIIWLIRYNILSAFISLDEQRAITRVQVAQELLRNELGMMKILAKDWSLWDEIYQYAQGGNPAFAQDYLTLEQLQALEIDVLLVVDTQTTMVGGVMVNQQSTGVVAISPEIMVATGSALIHMPLEKVGENKDVLLVSGKPLLLASASILQSSGEGPIAGVVVMGRWLTEDIVEQWQVLASGPLAMRSVHQTAKTEIEAEGVVYSNNHEPVFEFYSLNARDGYAQGRRLYLLLTGFVLTFLTIVVIVVWLVLSRRGRLKEQAKIALELRAREIAQKNTELEQMNRLMAQREQLMQQKAQEIEEKNREAESNKRAMMNLLEDGRELEEELKREKAGVELKVHERTRELTEKTKALENAQKEVTENWLQQQREKARLWSSINGLSLGFILTDNERGVLMSNQAVNRILMETVEVWTFELLNQKLEGKLDLINRWQDCVTLRKEISQGEVIFHDKILRIVLEPVIVHEETERVIGVVVLIEDVTEAKRLQRSRDEFFAVASHELRTPLTAIRGNMALIRDYYPQLLADPQVKQMVDDTHNASLRLIAIVNDFLDASRLELKKLEFKKEAFELDQLVEHVMKELESSAKEKGIGWEWQLAGEGQTKVVADKGRTEQILLNLCGNAIKFTKQGKVTVGVRVDNGVVGVAVSDTGVGIKPEDQDKLFAKFQQAGNNTYTRDVSGGTGMGLYVSRLLAEGMGGKVYLEKSRLEEGSTFIFELPVAG